jgi:hypothetical protein
MKRNFKQGWYTIPPISTKRTPIFHRNSLKQERKHITTHDVGIPGAAIKHTLKCGGVKLVSGILTLPS